MRLRLDDGSEKHRGRSIVVDALGAGHLLNHLAEVGRIRGYERGLRFLGRARAAALRGFTFGEDAVMLPFSSSANNFLTGSTRDIRGKGVS